MSDVKTPTGKGTGLRHACSMTRRRFLVLGSATAIATQTISLTLYPGQEVKAEVATYPRKLIGKLSELKDHTPVAFSYPDDLANSSCMLVKMGDLEGGGGIGPKRDVVAFSYLCSHQGGPLQGSYKVTGDQCTLGQCPLHLSLFDMRRHGIVVSGQAYQSLPQVMLELDGDDIYAVGVMGLIYGRNQNLMTA